jgi:hypothetical protein
VPNQCLLKFASGIKARGILGPGGRVSGWQHVGYRDYTVPDPALPRVQDPGAKIRGRSHRKGVDRRRLAREPAGGTERQDCQYLPGRQGFRRYICDVPGEGRERRARERFKPLLCTENRKRQRCAVSLLLVFS